MNLRSTWWHTLLKWHRWGRLRRRASVGPLAWWPNLLHRTYSRFHLIPKSAYFSVVVHTVGWFECAFLLSNRRRNKCLLLRFLLPSTTASLLFSFFLRLVDNFIEACKAWIFLFTFSCNFYTFHFSYSELWVTLLQGAFHKTLLLTRWNTTFLFFSSSLRLQAFSMDSRINWDFFLFVFSLGRLLY